MQTAAALKKKVEKRYPENPINTAMNPPSKRPKVPGEEYMAYKMLSKEDYIEEYNSYYDGYKLIVNNKYLVPIIESGIVVFIGDIDNYGYTIIIEGIDGVDIWYANVENTSLKVYDYVIPVLCSALLID